MALDSEYSIAKDCEWDTTIKVHSVSVMRSAYPVKAVASRDGMCLVLNVMTGAWHACYAMW